MATAVKLLAFAGARDIIGEPELRLELTTEATAGDVMAALCLRFPALTPHRPSLRLAVNGRYAHDDAPIQDGDEIALIPPVAGG